jgi:hypothetical protein
MAYIAQCPVCKKEKFYDNSNHLYLLVKGESEYVCFDCESILKIKKKVEDPIDSKIQYSLEVCEKEDPTPWSEKYHLIKNHRNKEREYYVQRITWTVMS